MAARLLPENPPTSTQLQPTPLPASDCWVNPGALPEESLTHSRAQRHGSSLTDGASLVKGSRMASSPRWKEPGQDSVMELFLLCPDPHAVGEVTQHETSGPQSSSDITTGDQISQFYLRLAKPQNWIIRHQPATQSSFTSVSFVKCLDLVLLLDGGVRISEAIILFYQPRVEEGEEEEEEEEVEKVFWLQEDCWGGRGYRSPLDSTGRRRKERRGDEREAVGEEGMGRVMKFQIQRGTSDPNSYKSLGDCFRTVFRNEGIYGFYKGIMPPILAETPKRAVKFFTFEQYKKLLGLTPLSTGLALSVAGLGSGLTEAIVVNPFEVVKVSLQANRDSFKEQPSSFGQARHIINADGFGLKGLNKGLTSTLGRHGVFNMIYFGFYFNVKDAIPASPDPTLEFMRKFAIGLTSGTISSCVNIPFDVAKSRIQGPQPVPGEIKYRTCFQTMGLVYREEGYVSVTPPPPQPPRQ
ncbi:Mitochondrial 2-oxodicarboxylate carrier [Merluccius polli]|uniref:Mitochondrial 2-oxodicarboxylate carrier n=1 Tax=Merluccius polli TaxID=89951 RepID=A0AA47NQW7_MERPO|nr:Mitochondrial 2-oxodicarboxylate carrier [Merluccius polli]